MKTRNQKFAACAFQFVNEFKARNEKKESRDRYGAFAHSLPVTIRTAGLTQALAFVDARGKDEGMALLAHLAATVYADEEASVRPNLPKVIDGDEENRNKRLTLFHGHLLAQSRDADLREYMRLTQRTLAALLWFKRFAQTVLDVAPGQKAADISDAATDETPPEEVAA